MTYVLSCSANECEFMFVFQKETFLNFRFWNDVKKSWLLYLGKKNCKSHDMGDFFSSSAPLTMCGNACVHSHIFCLAGMGNNAGILRVNTDVMLKPKHNCLITPEIAKDA